jgi:hypothetical protein
MKIKELDPMAIEDNKIDMSKDTVMNTAAVSDNEDIAYTKGSNVFSYFPNEYFYRIYNFKKNLEKLRAEKVEAMHYWFKDTGYKSSANSDHDIINGQRRDESNITIEQLVYNKTYQNVPDASYVTSTTVFASPTEMPAGVSVAANALTALVPGAKDVIDKATGGPNGDEFKNKSTSLWFLTDDSVMGIAKQFFNETLKIASNRVADYATGKLVGLQQSTIKQADKILGSVKGWVNKKINDAFEYTDWGPKQINRRIDNKLHDITGWMARHAGYKVKWFEKQRDDIMRIKPVSEYVVKRMLSANYWELSPDSTFKNLANAKDESLMYANEPASPDTVDNSPDGKFALRQDIFGKIKDEKPDWNASTFKEENDPRTERKQKRNIDESDIVTGKKSDQLIDTKKWQREVASGLLKARTAEEQRTMHDGDDRNINPIFKQDELISEKRNRATESQTYLGDKDKPTPTPSKAEDSLIQSFSAEVDDANKSIDFSSLDLQKIEEEALDSYVSHVKKVLKDTGFGKTKEEREIAEKAINDGIKTVAVRAIAATINDAIKEVTSARTKGEKSADGSVGGGTYLVTPLEVLSGAKQIFNSKAGTLEDGTVANEEPVEVEGEIETVNGEQIMVKPSKSIRHWESVSNNQDKTLGISKNMMLEDLFSSPQVANAKADSMYEGAQSIVAGNYLEDPRNLTARDEKDVEALILARIAMSLMNKESNGASFVEYDGGIEKGALSANEMKLWQAIMDKLENPTSLEINNAKEWVFTKASILRIWSAVKRLQYGEINVFNSTSGDPLADADERAKEFEKFVARAVTAYDGLIAKELKLQNNSWLKYDDDFAITKEALDILLEGRTSILINEETKRFIDKNGKRITAEEHAKYMAAGWKWGTFMDETSTINFFESEEWKTNQPIYNLSGIELSSWDEYLAQKADTSIRYVQDLTDGKMSIAFNEKEEAKKIETDTILSLIDAYESRWDILNTATSLLGETTLGSTALNKLEKGKQFLSGVSIWAMSKLTTAIWGNGERPNPGVGVVGYPKRSGDNALSSNYERDGEGNVIYEIVPNLTHFDKTLEVSQGIKDKFGKEDGALIMYYRVSTDKNQQTVRKVLKKVITGDETVDFSDSVTAGLYICNRMTRLADDALFDDEDFDEFTNPSSNFQAAFKPTGMFDLTEDSKQDNNKLADVNTKYGFFDVSTKYRVNKTFRGGEIEYFKSGYFHYFFVKPDLNLSENHIHVMDYGNNPILTHALPELCYSTRYLDKSWAGEAGPWHLDEEMQNYRTAYMNPYFSPLLSNAIKQLNIPDYTLDNREGFENMFGHKVTFGTTGRRSGYGTDFSISFYDTKELLLMNIMQIWIKYIEVMYEGQAGLRCLPRQAGNLDYLGALYYFVLEPDGQSISHWGRYTGIYPTGVPWSSVQMASGSSDIPEFNVNFKCQWHEWNNVAVLHDFNFLMRGGPWYPTTYHSSNGNTHDILLDFKGYSQLSEIYKTSGLYNYSDSNLLAGGLVSENRALVEYISLLRDMDTGKTVSRKTPHRMPYKFILHFTSTDNETMSEKVSMGPTAWANTYRSEALDDILSYTGENKFVVTEESANEAKNGAKSVADAAMTKALSAVRSSGIGPSF